MRTALITGLGQCSSLGVGVASFWSALTAGRSGLCPVERLAPGAPALAAPLRLPEDVPVPQRLPAALRGAILEAAADAGLPESRRASATVVAGSNFGDAEGYPSHGDFLRPLREALAELGFGGELWALSTACASGAGILGIAADLVRHEQAELVLVCAYDAITPYNYGGLHALHAVSPDTIRPFDRRRSGTLLGEAVAALVVEAGPLPADRPAPYAEIAGYGISNDAHHFTAPEPTGIGIRTAMHQALEEAGLQGAAVDHLNAHGTGTPHNDVVESRAVRAVFGSGADGIAVTSIKAAVGHTMGAAGALECLTTVLSLRHGLVPPVLNFAEPDPDCDLDYVVGRTRPAALRTAMSNSYGLWGCNASVVLRRVPASPDGGRRP